MNTNVTSADSVDAAAMTALSDIRSQVSAAVRGRVHQHVTSQAASLADHFYHVMLHEPVAAGFLNNEQVQTRLRASMQRWLVQTFAEVTDNDMPALIGRQTQVGAVHARIKLPPQLMSMGIRLLVRRIRDGLAQAGLQGDDLRTGQLYAADLMYLADSLMLRAYVRDMQREVRADEAYRSVAMRHNAPLERERQRAALSEWINEVLFTLRPGRHVRVERLLRSEFGNWLEHKARLLFESADDLASVFDVCHEIDEVLLPLLEGHGPDTEDGTLFEQLRAKIEFLRYLLNDLFERLGSIEQGRDTTTGLLGRRHLSALLGREMQQHTRGEPAFALLLGRVDQMEIAYAQEDAQHVMLQQLSALLQSVARAGDHLLRYGNTEFLLVVVETQEQSALEMAEAMRYKVWGHHFLLSGNASTRLTMSIGVALYDGHPDYQQLLRRAEQAVVRAATDGGNRVVQAR
jgi:diguanylate cyclase